MTTVPDSPTVPTPISVGLEPSSLCSLSCPCCPAQSGAADPSKGFMGLENAKAFLDLHPGIRYVSLRGRGELFLNPDLPELLRLADERGVATTMAAGSNLNVVSEEAAEAVVRYGVRSIRCAVDGVTRETYRQYRRGGDLGRVIRNVQKINAIKARYRSSFPRLVFQFIPFAHNVHELDQAAMLARMLEMTFVIRLNRHLEELDPEAKAKVRRYAGYADRDEFLLGEGVHYFRILCSQLWMNPRFGWDGRVLGCSCNNNYGYFPGNVFEDDLSDCLNSEVMIHAREMLMGHRSAREDIPCVRCECYQAMQKDGRWVTEEEIVRRRESMGDEFGERTA